MAYYAHSLKKVEMEQLDAEIMRWAARRGAKLYDPKSFLSTINKSVMAEFLKNVSEKELAEWMPKICKLLSWWEYSSSFGVSFLESIEYYARECGLSDAFYSAANADMERLSYKVWISLSSFSRERGDAFWTLYPVFQAGFRMKSPLTPDVVAMASTVTAMDSAFEEHYPMLQSVLEETNLWNDFVAARGQFSGPGDSLDRLMEEEKKRFLSGWQMWDDAALAAYYEGQIIDGRPYYTPSNPQPGFVLLVGTKSQVISGLSDIGQAMETASSGRLQVTRDSDLASAVVLGRSKSEYAGEYTGGVTGYASRVDLWGYSLLDASADPISLTAVNSPGHTITVSSSQIVYRESNPDVVTHTRWKGFVEELVALCNPTQ